MSSSTLTTVPHDGGMAASQPRLGGPTRRRSFTPAQKLDHLAAYEAAVTQGSGGAYLRREALYSPQITEWRRLRDAGVLAGRPAGARVGRPGAEQSEIARLRRQTGRGPAPPEQDRGGIRHHGKKTRAPGRDLRERAGATRAPRGVDGHLPGPAGRRHHHQGGGQVTGISRARAGRKPAAPWRATWTVPANRLSGPERARGDRDAGLTPLRLPATLAGLCPVFGREHLPVLGLLDVRRSLANTTRSGNGAGWTATRPGSVPSWSPPPGAGVLLGHHQARRPGQGHLLRRLRDD
jgi:hypothetical protein